MNIYDVFDTDELIQEIKAIPHVPWQVEIIIEMFKDCNEIQQNELIQIVKNIEGPLEKIEAIKLLSALTNEYQKDLLNTEIDFDSNSLEDSHLINVDDL